MYLLSGQSGFLGNFDGGSPMHGHKTRQVLRIVAHCGASMGLGCQSLHVDAVVDRSAKLNVGIQRVPGRAASWPWLMPRQLGGVPIL
jgi:hypothetical protein